MAETTPGITVEGSDFIDVNGEPLVLRGVNHGHTRVPDHTEVFAETAGLGANAIRVALSAGTQDERDDADDVAEVLGRCRESELVCVLDVHDTTGWGDTAGAAPLSTAVDYWIGLRETLAGTEDFVVVNIANAPFGRSVVDSWLPDSSEAIARLREAGIRHALVVDGPDDSQDSSRTMVSNASRLLSADPDGNTMLSVHMYEVYGYEGAVDSYLDSYRDRDLPIMVGEFGWGHSADLSGVREEDVLARADVSWFASSWCTTDDSVERLDLVTGGCDSTTLSDWGQDVSDHLGDTQRAAALVGSSDSSGAGTRTGSAPAPAPELAPEPETSPSPVPSAVPEPEQAPVADPPTGSDGGPASQGEEGPDRRPATTPDSQGPPSGGDGAAPDGTGDLTASADASDLASAREEGSGAAPSSTAGDPPRVPEPLPAPWPFSLLFDQEPSSPLLLAEETHQSRHAAPPSDPGALASAESTPTPTATPTATGGHTPAGDRAPSTSSAPPSPPASSDPSSDTTTASSAEQDPAPNRTTRTAPSGHRYCVEGAASDPDRDGWGWENEQSCVVRGGLADHRPDDAPPPPMAPNGRPYCEHADLTDPDGDGWGWEHLESCIVPGGPADPAR